MRFRETALRGAFVVELEPRVDARGFFARAFCAEEFAAHGLRTSVAQSNIAFNHRRGTVRGMHYQLPPSAEAKLVRCTRGAVHDVIVDLRPGSATYGRHVAAVLSADDRRALYVPELFAHGYQTLVDDAEVFYQASEFYAPAAERGFRYDDAALGIAWPLPVSEISAKDAAWPAFVLERPR
ncbi:MAG: dTDP-4-dehydrorhamnose 3,5-epimerase [Candidatus Limnocylindria bacterium]